MSSTELRKASHSISLIIPYLTTDSVRCHWDDVKQTVFL